MSAASTEHTPLLRLNNGEAAGHSRQSSFARVKSMIFPGESQPSYFASFRWFLFGSFWNLLLVFVPLSFVADKLEWDVALRFWFSFIAIMPLAKLLGEATEQLAIEVGQTFGALLNASFGNAVEIIVGIAALLQGQLRLVQTSMLGSILSNILLVLGCSCFFGGLKHHEGVFQVTGAQAASSLMTLSCITLIIPAAYIAARGEDSTHPTPHDGLNFISRGTSIILLVVYIFYLFFQLKTHADLFREPDVERNHGNGDSHHHEENEELKMNLPAAGIALLGVTVVTSFCADYLVASIEEFAERYDIPTAFIGLILLPLVANAAEHFTAVWMAMKGKMELTIGISIGSSIQISSFVVPLLVLVGWISGHELTLFFENFETIVLTVSVLLVQFLVQDGKSNYMEGLMLLCLYIVIAIAVWVS